ncbi:Syntaxin-18 [Trichinella zimbabwensis]|uniref:Syntaxin-18 n=1 Tax=Trichinella zimbabwensis TaxID=268475 RepID=A0A0V1I4M7_9BILA|nr:Syntaxin-18 [Trichinella zimbabwensis]
MDIHPLFLARTKMIQATRKGLVNSTASPSASRNPDVIDFSKQTQALLKDLIELETFISNYKHNYTAVENLYDISCLVSQQEHLQLDRLAVSVIGGCEVMLKKMAQIQEKLTGLGEQREKHNEAVLQGLRRILNTLTVNHSIINVASAQRSSRLQIESKLKNLVKANRQYSGNTQEYVKNYPISTPDQHADCKEDSVRRRMVVVNRTLLQEELEKDKERFDVDFNDAEAQKFEMEQLTLKKTLATEKSDIDKLQAQITKISDLQRTFVENICSQEEIIDKIGQSAVSSVDFMRISNNAIRQAIGKKASDRFWFMFITIVLTLTLWFLHFYNP